MIIEATFNGARYKIDLSKPMDISIELRAGRENPNCYYAQPPAFETIVMGDFVGSVERGGPVNYQQITLTPHGNGTHTEVYGHISTDKATIASQITSIHEFAEVISIPPSQHGEDQVLSFDEFMKRRTSTSAAVVIRTLPNDDAKKTRHYSGTNPPYLDHRIAEQLRKEGVQHLLIDLPSVDKEVDGGQLAAHRAFWDNETRKNATITELIFVPDSISDGLYFLNLQLINLASDACPSRPVLFEIIKQ